MGEENRTSARLLSEALKNYLLSQFMAFPFAHPLQIDEASALLFRLKSWKLWCKLINFLRNDFAALTVVRAVVPLHFSFSQSGALVWCSGNVESLY